MGGIKVTDSRESITDDTVDPIYVCTCINEGYDDECIAMAQIYNYDFRQFCRNWSVEEEVAQPAQARERGTR